MTTNNHPAHGPVSLDRLHQIREILSKAAAQSDGGNLGYAMADAVKVIDGVITAFGAEPVAWRWFHLNQWHVTNDEERERDLYWDSVKVTPLYAAPPAPVVPDEKPMPEASKMYAIDAVAAIAEVRGWNACRAAMLQAGNSPSKCSLRDGIEAIRNSGIPVDVDKIQSECEAGNHTEQHIDMVDHSGDDNENADYRLPFDHWLSQQNEPIDVDCGCVTTEAFYHWLRVAYEAGNSPVTPDGWIPVSERMPEVGVKVLCFPVDDEPIHAVFNGQLWLQDISWSNSDEPIDNAITCNVTHWMPLPAAPQQEVGRG